MPKITLQFPDGQVRALAADDQIVFSNGWDVADTMPVDWTHDGDMLVVTKKWIADRGVFPAGDHCHVRVGDQWVRARIGR